MLAQQRGFGVQRGQQRIFGHRNVGGEKYALQAVFLVKPLGQPQNLIIRFGACADDHLRALPRGRELRGFAIPHQLGLALRDALAHLLHGGKNGAFALVWSQQRKAPLTGKFDIDADAVRQQAEPRHQRRVRSGNGFCVDITAKAVLAPQQLQHADHLFHRVVRTAQHRTGEEQPFDVIAAVEPDGQIRQFARRKGGAGHIIGHTVHTVFAVVNAAVAQQHLQQADAPAVSRKGMAQPGGHSAAKAGLVARPLGAAGCTGHVIFCAVRQDRQFFQHIHARSSVPVYGGFEKGVKKKALTKHVFFHRALWDFK